jgi:hypothetical protein
LIVGFDAAKVTVGTGVTVGLGGGVVVPDTQSAFMSS